LHTTYSIKKQQHSVQDN